MTDRATLTADELAALLGINRKSVYEGCDRGEIPHLRIGRRIVFPKAAMDAWLACTASKTTGDAA